MPCRKSIPVVVDIRELWPDNYLFRLPPLLRPLGKVILQREFARSKRILRNAAGIIASCNEYVMWGLKVAERPARKNDGSFVLGSYVEPVGRS